MNTQVATYRRNRIGMASLVIMFLLACSSQPTRAAKVPTGFTERDAEVNGVRIHYSIGGKGSPVVLLHGYAQTSHMWNPIMPLLAGNHTVIVPDLRGAGGSSKPESGYDKKNMTVDIHDLVTSLGFKRASVVGHDIGLMVAYAYAAQFPQETERLVLMDAFLPGIGDWKNVWLMRNRAACAPASSISKTSSATRRTSQSWARRLSRCRCLCSAVRSPAANSSLGKPSWSHRTCKGKSFPARD